MQFSTVRRSKQLLAHISSGEQTLQGLRRALQAFLHILFDLSRPSFSQTSKRFRALGYSAS